MDNEKLKKFMIPIALIVLTIVSAVFITNKINTDYRNSNINKNSIEQKTQELKQIQETLARFQKQKAEEQKQEAAAKSGTSEKPFYKPTASGMDTEAVIAGEFTEILELIRANKIKVRSIKYEYDPQDDNFVKGGGYNVARLNMEMVANYVNYNNFLKELYKHEHFIDIESVEIVPYRKNKRILLINFKLKLYSKK